MPRKLENLEFAKNIARSIASKRKLPPAMRLRALDRFCELCKLYKIEDQDRRGGKKPEKFEEVPTQTGLDAEVNAMLKRFKGDKNGH